MTADGDARQNINVGFKNCAPFTSCISEINNTQIDNAKDLEIIMPMYNLLEYSENYAKTSGSLFRFSRDPGGAVVNNEQSFIVKSQGETVIPAGAVAATPGRLDMEMVVPL